MSNQVKESLRKTFVRVLEDWALMMVDPVEAGKETSLFESDENLRIASVEFKGVVSGTYSVVCSDAFLKVLTSNLLGTDDELEPDQLADAAKEMINVLSGNCLTDSYGEDNEFALTAPDAKSVNVSEVQKLLSDRALFALGDGMPVVFSFELDSSK